MKNTHLECQPWNNTEMKIRKTVCGNVGYCFFSTEVWSLPPQKQFNCLLPMTPKGIFPHFCLQHKRFFHNLSMQYNMFPTKGTKPNVVLKLINIFHKTSLFVIWRCKCNSWYLWTIQLLFLGATKSNILHKQPYPFTA